MLTPRHKPRQRGFTMIEMAITMVIFGILLAAALPSISEWTDNARIRNTAEALQNGIQIARNEAVRRNQPVSFYLVSSESAHEMSSNCTRASDNSSWVVSLSDPTGQCDQPPSDVNAPMILVRRPSGDAGTRVSIAAVDATGTGATALTFNGFGRIAANADGSQSIRQITITGLDANTHYRNMAIQISQQGMVRTCEPDIVATSDDPRKCQ